MIHGWTDLHTGRKAVKDDTARFAFEDLKQRCAIP